MYWLGSVYSGSTTLALVSKLQRCQNWMIFVKKQLEMDRSALWKRNQWIKWSGWRRLVHVEDVKVNLSLLYHKYFLWNLQRSSWNTHNMIHLQVTCSPRNIQQTSYKIICSVELSPNGGSYIPSRETKSLFVTYNKNWISKRHFYNAANNILNEIYIWLQCLQYFKLTLLKTLAHQ